MNELEYWDNIATQSVKEKGLVDNYLKRRKLIRELLKYDFEYAKILEIGTGLGITAYILKILYGYHIDYTGTDISGKFCDIARGTLKHKMIQTKAENMPFEDKTFDILFAFDCLEHIPIEDRPSVYKELDRVLKDKAVIFINNPCKTNPSGHDKDFDFTFNESDLAKLCNSLNMELLEFVHYDGHRGYRYQFIVIQRGTEC